MTATCAQFRVAGTLPISGFVSEDRLELKHLSRCFRNSKRKETAYNLGVTFQTVHYGLNRK